MSLRRGMSLIETIVAMAIFAILIVMIFPALALLNHNNTISQDILEATYYTQQVAERINEVSLSSDSDKQMIHDALLSDGFSYTTNTYVKFNDPYEITVTTFDVTDSENLWRVVIVAENDASDYSQVEMVVRLSAEE